jgi:2'-5' RNA ligase
MRHFFAFPVPSGFDRGVAWQMSHAVFPSGLEWVLPINYHLTICFLGETEEEKLPAIIEKAHALALQFPPFEIVSRVITHYPQKEPNMLWVKFDQSPDFEKIYESFHREFEIPLRFHGAQPHITLARFPKRKHITYRKHWGGYKLKLDHFHLMRSARHNEILRYEPLESFPLKG